MSDDLYRTNSILMQLPLFAELQQRCVEFEEYVNLLKHNIAYHEHESKKWQKTFTKMEKKADKYKLKYTKLKKQQRVHKPLDKPLTVNDLQVDHYYESDDNEIFNAFCTPIKKEEIVAKKLTQSNISINSAAEAEAFMAKCCNEYESDSELSVGPNEDPAYIDPNLYINSSEAAALNKKANVIDLTHLSDGENTIIEKEVVIKQEIIEKEQEEEEEEQEEEEQEEEEQEEEEEEEEEEEQEEVVEEEVVEEEVEEEVVEEEEEEQEQEEEEQEEEKQEEEQEEEEVEQVEAEEEQQEDEDVYEITIQGKTYYVSNEKNSVIYAADDEGEISIEAGIYKNGVPTFY